LVESGARVETTLGQADDDGVLPGDGLSYIDAMQAAVAWAAKQRVALVASANEEKRRVLTVADAINSYVKTRIARDELRGQDARTRLAKHVLGDARLSAMPFERLTARTLTEWRARLPGMAPAGVNRLLNDVRAALNGAVAAHWRDLPATIGKEIETGLKALPNAETARQALLIDADIRRIVEAAYAMAPGANELVVGGDGCDNGDSGLQGLFDADLAVLNGNGSRPLATIASNSWGSGDETQPALLTNIEHAYLLKAAAEGVGMYFSSGDAAGTAEPAVDPYAIAVGGTSLGIGKTGNRLFETGWSKTLTGYFSDPVGVNAWQPLAYQADGGGASLLWSQPSYQRGIVPKALATAPSAGNRGGASLVRSVPDISADADPDTGMMIELQLTDSTGAVTGYAPEEVEGFSAVVERRIALLTQL